MPKTAQNEAQPPDVGRAVTQAPLPTSSSTVSEPVTRSPVIQLCQWIASFAIPGIGMFMEAYFIFSVGNVKPIWEQQYPQCWKAGL